ncbi:MAG: class A beta-lactamase-related serine hydrolase, partial [Gammaproteobacteria bacterium]
MLARVREAFHLADTALPLDDITVRDQTTEVEPEGLGLDSRAIDRIWNELIGLYRTGTQPAIQICLRYKGQVVMNRAIGCARGGGPGDSPEETRLPVKTDTPFCLFSASKAITAILVHKLAEQGKINLMDPVAFYLPEFGKKGKRNITIHQILAHRGGIPGLPTKGVSLDTLYDPDEVWRLLCEAEPIAVDGGKLAYHAITGGFVLGRVIEKTTGKTMREYIREVLIEPMGMTYMNFGLTADQIPLSARNYATGPDTPFPLSWAVRRALGADMRTAAEVSNDLRWFDAVIPAANIYATAEETSRFYQMLLNEGRWGRRQVLKPMTVKRATHEFGECAIDRTMLIPMRYS